MNAEPPTGWCIAPTSDVAEVFLGKTPAKSAYVSHGTLKVVKFRDLQDGRVDFENADAGFVRDEKAALAGLRELRPGDVLITSTAHSGEHIGKKCAYVSSLPSEYARVFFTGELLGIRCTDDTLRRWIHLFFASTDGYLEIQNAVSGVHLTSGRAQGMLVPFAPLDEQRRIVARAEALLELANACRGGLAATPRVISRLRRAVLASAFSGRLTAGWRAKHCDVESGASLLELIKTARLSVSASTRELNQISEVFPEGQVRSDGSEDIAEDVPTSWLPCRIGSIGTVVNGSTPSRRVDGFWGGTIPWASSGEVRNNVITETRERITRAGYDNSSVRLLPRGTVLLAMIGEGKTRGQSALLQIESTINQNIAAVLVPHGLVNSTFLWRWFQFQYEATRERGSGSGPQALNCQRVRELPFVLPPLAEQEEIVRLVERLFLVADRIQARCTAARAQVEQLTQSILAKAFRGELVPTEAELAEEEGRTYESASELLARIRRPPAASRERAPKRK